MGSLLQEIGLEPGQAPEQFMLEHPDRVVEVQGAYVRAGSDMVITNTFGASPLKLRDHGLENRTEEINRLAVEAVRSRGKSTLGFGFEYQTTLNFDGAVQDFFRLGGFQRLSGYERGAISGPHAAVAKLIFYRRIGDSPGGFFEAPVYLGGTADRP